MTAKLYCFGESGHSYKAALAATLAGYGWEPRFVDFFKGEHRTPEFLAINAMGECPVLVDGDVTLTQSGVIQRHIARATGKLGGAPGEEEEVLRWILWDNHKFSSQIGMLRFFLNFLPPEKQSQDVIGFTAGRVKAALKTLEAHLQGRDWIVGDAVTIADCTVCGYLYYPEPFGFDRADWPNIDRWLSNIAALPGWKHPYDMMPGNPSDRA